MRIIRLEIERISVEGEIYLIKRALGLDKRRHIFVKDFINHVR
jgi:hypothetical protein